MVYRKKKDSAQASEGCGEAMSARLLYHANWFIVAAFVFVFTRIWFLSGYGAMAANKAGTPDVHKLEAAYALSKGSSKLEAQEAYFDGEQFFINYIGATF